MKINPPKAIIGKEDPFEHTLFDRKEFAESLTGLLRNVEENLVIFVNAPWGEGKTTFAEMWRAQLKQRELDVIYFDAYAADYFDDPFVSFSGEILEFASKHLPGGKTIKESREFKDTAVEVGKRLAGLALKVGIRAATLNAVDATHLDELKEIGTEVASGVSEISADFIEKKIENYGVEKDALKKFKKSLEKLAAKVREKQKFPLTIIVDELDRCRPDFALGLLERIKHLFDVEGVAFVLLVNRNQIESYIQAVYGNVDAGAYLLKFGNLFVELPNQRHANSNFQYVNGRKEFCSRLVAHFEISSRVRNGRQVAIYMSVFANHFDLTLREIEKAFTIMAIYYSSVTQGQSNNDFLTSLLSIVKINISFGGITQTTPRIGFTRIQAGVVGKFRERAERDFGDARRVAVRFAEHIGIMVGRVWVGIIHEDDAGRAGVQRERASGGDAVRSRAERITIKRGAADIGIARRRINGEET